MNRPTAEAPQQALQAIQEAVQWIETAREIAERGTGRAFQVSDAYRNARKAIRTADRRLEEAARGNWPGYEIERDETGMPVRLWWPCRPQEEQT